MLFSTTSSNRGFFAPPISRPVHFLLCDSSLLSLLSTMSQSANLTMSHASQSSAPLATIRSLPSELIFAIFELLCIDNPSSRDLLRASLVCWAWCHQAQYLLWRSIRLCSKSEAFRFLDSRALDGTKRAHCGSRVAIWSSTSTEQL